MSSAPSINEYVEQKLRELLTLFNQELLEGGNEKDDQQDQRKHAALQPFHRVTNHKPLETHYNSCESRGGGNIPAGFILHRHEWNGDNQQD